VLMFGPLPAYRDLAEPPRRQPPAPPFTGRDVEEFEANLAALGYRVTVDETFTAVRKWQKDLGVPETGVVGIGDVVYAAGPVRVAKPLVRLGAPASGMSSAPPARGPCTSTCPSRRRTGRCEGRRPRSPCLTGGTSPVWSVSVTQPQTPPTGGEASGVPRRRPQYRRPGMGRRRPRQRTMLTRPS
jgi:hypothetical protein